jgi:hypothetical protein
MVYNNRKFCPVHSAKLTDRQKEIMREFAELNGESIEEQPSNFKDRARKFHDHIHEHF